MKRFVLAGCLLASAASQAGPQGADWVPVASGDTGRILLDAASVERNASNEVRFQVRRILSSQQDMMGLGYNATQSRYVLSCDAGQILFRQQFLLQGDEVVWTFPESSKPQRAGDELPEILLETLCPNNAGGVR